MSSSLTSIRLALLRALLTGRGFSLELVARVAEQSGRRLDHLAVYPALADLEDEGLVRSYDGEPLAERGGRPRRYYELTADGQAFAKGLEVGEGAAKKEPKVVSGRGKKCQDCGCIEVWGTPRGGHAEGCEWGLI